MSKGLKIKWATTFWLAFILFFLTLGQIGWSQYPTKPITMIVGWAAGGSTDVTIRALSEAASKILGQPIVVLNKPGGGSAVALALLKNEKPDGYTIGNISAAGITSQHMRKVPYDVAKDFTPIMRYADYTMGVVVRVDSPWKTFKQLVEYARANPGKIKYSTPGAGTLHHLVMEALSVREGIKWTHIPFEGGHPATTALLGGHVDVEASSSEWKPHVESGTLRLLSTYMPERLATYPDVPTWIESGYNISTSSLVGIIGPQGIPRPIVDKLHEAYKKALDNPEFKKAMRTLDMPIIYRDPEGLARNIKELSDQWGKLIIQLGLRKE